MYTHMINVRRMLILPQYDAETKSRVLCILEAKSDKIRMRRSWGDYTKFGDIGGLFFCGGRV